MQALIIPVRPREGSNMTDVVEAKRMARALRHALGAQSIASPTASRSN